MKASLTALWLMAFAAPASGQAVSVTLDSLADRIEILVGPLELPAASAYTHHIAQPTLRFRWPATGWVTGFRVALLDSAGRELPREMLHHAGVANLDRRQLAYPTAERLFAAGRETGPVELPSPYGIPLVRDHQMLLYYALANETRHDIPGATLRITMSWKREGTAGMRTVMPIYFDASPRIGALSTFDVPPGLSTTAAEFTLPAAGHLRYLGGHLHDHGVELRLEDASQGTVLARLPAERTTDGRVLGVARTRFLSRRNGLRLEARHPYRVVAVYRNPTCAPLAGNMGVLVAVFVPEDMARWPAVDVADESYRTDLAWLSASQPADAVEAHDHGVMVNAAEGRAPPTSCAAQVPRPATGGGYP